MRTELADEDFIKYQLFVKRFVNNYNNRLRSGLNKIGYISKYCQDFVYLMGKKNNGLISLPSSCKKISYGNIMDFYELFPYEIEKRNIPESESKLEAIVDKFCTQELVDFAFNKEISLNAWENKKFGLAEINSVLIPIKAIIYSPNEEIIQKVLSTIDPPLSIFDKIKHYLKKDSEEVVPTKLDLD